MSADPLLTPFHLRHLQLRNRIVSTSHEPAYSEDGLPTDRYRAYHVEKAKGGVGLTMIGGSALVSRESAPAFGNLQLWKDEAVPHLRRLADEVHEHGAAVMTQLTHLGHRTSSYSDNWLPVMSVSRVRESAHRSFTRPAEKFDFDRIANEFADTVERCKVAGLDGVELEAYGHLLDAFWSPWRNHREDEYGGSFDNRMRFPLQVLRTVRERVGDDYLIGVRMSFDEQHAGGVGRDETVQIAKALTDNGIDFISVIRGNMDNDASLSAMIPPMGTPSAPHLEFAGWVRKNVDVPIMHASRISDVATARHAVAEGLLDLVGMTRAMIADPELVNKIASGDSDRIRPCVGASVCIDGIYAPGGASYCIHNPSTGRELQLPHKVGTAATAKKIAVVGGGPAGLEAARTLGERGHEVELFEASDRFGGQILLAAKSQRRRDLIGIVDWRVAECKRLGVEMKLGSYVEAGDLVGKGYDVVIVATGGMPDVDVAPGCDLATDSWDVMSGSVKLTGDVVVYDDNGATPALDAAEMAAATAKSVEFVTPERTLAPDVGGITLAPYLQMLAENEVTITAAHRLQSIEKVDGRLKATFAVDGARKSIERLVDTVIVEHGSYPNSEVYDDLVAGSVNAGEVVLDDLLSLTAQSAVHNEDGAYRLYRIGDAVASRSVQTAVLDAFRLCSAI